MPTEELAIVGNGETCALINKAGSVDWMCIPGFDSDFVFAKALDPKKGGYFTLEFLDKNKRLKPRSQNYLGDTNILETRLGNRDLECVVTDFMPWGKNTLVRKIQLRNKSNKNKEIDLQVKVKVTEPFSQEFQEKTKGELRIHKSKNYSIGYKILSDKIKLNSKETKDLSVIFAYGTPKQIENSIRNTDPGKLLNEEISFYEEWLKKAKELPKIDKKYIRFYLRSLLTLKSLTYERTGGIISGPTSSFPATIGGIENWDYRYVWARDGSYSADAFIKAGFLEEGMKQIKFFFNRQQSDGVFPLLSTVKGKDTPKERILDELSGPDGEKPVRIGNLAKDQLQVDPQGSVLRACWIYYENSQNIKFLKDNIKAIDKAVEWIIKNWYKKENGIWEVRDPPKGSDPRVLPWFMQGKKHFVHGKATCYEGVDTGIKVHRVLGLEVDSRWVKERERIRESILEYAWSEDKESFMQYWEGGDNPEEYKRASDAPFDITVLSIAECGVVGYLDPRIIKTAHKLYRELCMGGGIKRHSYGEAPFFLPTFMLAQYFIKIGDPDKSNELIDVCIKNATSLGLMSEHFDPIKNIQLGNRPQSYSHSGLIDTFIILNSSL